MVDGNGSEAVPARFVVSQFAQLQRPADALRQGQAPVVEVDGDRHLHRRIVDFLSGLAYGTEAELDRLDDGVYRLRPPG